jgi:hypothetical protein
LRPPAAPGPSRSRGDGVKSCPLTSLLPSRRLEVIRPEASERRLEPVSPGIELRLTLEPLVRGADPPPIRWRSGARGAARQLWLLVDCAGEDALTQLQGASIRYRIAVGPIAARKTLRLHTPGVILEGAQPPKPFTAARDGLSLNAAAAGRADERRRLERLHPHYI